MFSFAAGLLEPYLKIYQCDEPMLPYLCDDLKVMTKSILKLYIKPSVISACKTGSDLKKIDLKKDKNFLKSRDIHLGFATKPV